MEVGDIDYGGEGEGGARILIRGFKMGTGLGNRWFEFHKVDLEQGKLQENWFPRLNSWQGTGQMLFACEKLYVIGDKSEDGEGVSVLDTKEEGLKWKRFPLPIRSTVGNCASMGQKIYYHADPPKYSPEAFAAMEADPTFEFWESFSSPPEVGSRMSICAPVADPTNNRILVCLGDYGFLFLYAYYPHLCSMKLIRDSSGFAWSDAVALADDVLYVHVPRSRDQLLYAFDRAQLIYAFDVSEEGKGKSLAVAWTSTLVEGVRFDGSRHTINLCRFEFDALFHVGNNNFWTAIWNPDLRIQGNIYIYMVKFKACRSGDNIICTPLTFWMYLLHSTTKVFDFVLLA